MVADRVSNSIVPPESYVHSVTRHVRDEEEFDILAERDIRDLDPVVEERNPPIAVDHPGLPLAKDVLEQRVWFDKVSVVKCCAEWYNKSMARDKIGNHCLNDHERRKEDRDAQRR